MDSLTKKYLISFFNKNLALYGDRPEALRWTPRGQHIRYSVLSSSVSGDLTGKKILDYGCGKGDFYGFLKENGIPVRYTGMDINPSLINLASKKYPECSFRVFDIEEEDIREDYDFIFLCGVFNARVEGVTDAFKNILSRLFGHAQEGLAFNALSTHSVYKDVELNYIPPEEMLEFCMKLTPFISLRHDYLPDDFTVFLYKKDGSSRR